MEYQRNISTRHVVGLAEDLMIASSRQIVDSSHQNVSSHIVGLAEDPMMVSSW